MSFFNDLRFSKKVVERKDQHLSESQEEETAASELFGRQHLDFPSGMVCVCVAGLWFR